MRTERLVSAGGVVYRKADGRIEVALCGRKDPQLWVLPKGTPDAGESLEQTAIREVEEETGLKVRIVGKVTSIDYWFVRSQEQTRYHKTVHHFLMAPIGGSVELHDWEFDTVEWTEPEKALGRLTYDNERKVLRVALDMVAGLEREGAGGKHGQG